MPPGKPGGFQQGMGTFLSEEKDGDQVLLARGVRDRITPASCRWHQPTPTDGGRTWVPDGFMDWVRA